MGLIIYDMLHFYIYILNIIILKAKGDQGHTVHSLTVHCGRVLFTTLFVFAAHANLLAAFHFFPVLTNKLTCFHAAPSDSRGTLRYDTRKDWGTSKIRNNIFFFSSVLKIYYDLTKANSYYNFLLDCIEPKTLKI